MRSSSTSASRLAPTRTCTYAARTRSCAPPRPRARSLVSFTDFAKSDARRSEFAPLLDRAKAEFAGIEVVGGVSSAAGLDGKVVSTNGGDGAQPPASSLPGPVAAALKAASLADPTALPDAERDEV